MSDAASNLMQLFLAEEKHNTAHKDWERAGVVRTLSGIELRGAELASQACRYWGNNEFRKKFGEITDRERAIALAAVGYAQIGRVV